MLIVDHCSFDPLSSNSHCGYGPLSFGVPCLSPAALGGFPPLSRFGSDYFSSSPPGISSTYPGISHPALVSSYTNSSKEGASNVTLPPCCPPTDDSVSRSFHSWFPRHCPAAASSSLSSQLTCPPPTTSSRGGESSSTSLSSPEPTSLQTAAAAAAAAADDFRFDRRPSAAAAAAAAGRHGLGRYRHLGIGSAFRAGSTTSSLLAAKRTKVHLHHQQQPHHVKKPLNAFMLFMKEMRSKVIDECTLKESAAINQILGRKWHSLDRAEQARYYEMARREKLMHRQLFPGWTARDNYAVLARKAKRKLLQHQHRPAAQHSITTSVSGVADRADNANAKKCRARYGLEHQNRWCKPCRRKKRCIRFLDNSSSDDAPPGNAPAVAADSTSDPPPFSAADRLHHMSPVDQARHHHQRVAGTGVNREPVGDAETVASKSAAASLSGGGPWPSPVSCGTLMSPGTVTLGAAFHHLSPSSAAR